MAEVEVVEDGEDGGGGHGNSFRAGQGGERRGMGEAPADPGSGWAGGAEGVVVPVKTTEEAGRPAAGRGSA
ncbi:hypothetical protein CLM85_04180, partial [Streptomyces albidoflavus]